MNATDQVRSLIELVGGRENVLSATNCITRLRLRLLDPSLVQEDRVRQLDGVLGLVRDDPRRLEVVVGPGASHAWADACAGLGIPSSAPRVGAPSAAAVSGDVAPVPTSRDAISATSTKATWAENKKVVTGAQRQGRIGKMLKSFGEIFVPLIPGIIAAGICSGLATLVAQVFPGYASDPFWGVAWNTLTLISSSFLTFLTAWAGYRAAEQFGGTPILGGMLGMITSLANIDAIARLLGLYDDAQPLNAILRAGRGGVLAVIIGVWILCKIERALHERMPGNLDAVFTPLITLIACVVPYVLLIMPAAGFVSSALVWGVNQVCMNDSIIVRIVGGYLAAAVFLPMVAMGMHHGLVAIYAIQIEALGYVTLYPTLAMAGAGQVGAAIAIYLKARRCGNHRLCDVIAGALPAGVLGVGEPLIYGVTLPMGRPFITAGLGAGFGGAFAMATQIAATSWGPSGIIAIPIMTAGPNDAAASMAYYVIGLAISYVAAFLVTNFALSTEEVARA